MRSVIITPVCPHRSARLPSRMRRRGRGHAGGAGTPSSPAAQLDNHPGIHHRNAITRRGVPRPFHGVISTRSGSARGWIWASNCNTGACAFAVQRAVRFAQSKHLGVGRQAAAQWATRCFGRRDNARGTCWLCSVRPTRTSNSLIAGCGFRARLSSPASFQGQGRRCRPRSLRRQQIEMLEDMPTCGETRAGPWRSNWVTSSPSITSTAAWRVPPDG